MQLIILDRDGVINQDSDDYIKSADEWLPLPGSIEAIARLCRAGYSVAVATNQSGLGRELFDLDALEAIHEKMRGLVEGAGDRKSTRLNCSMLLPWIFRRLFQASSLSVTALKIYRQASSASVSLFSCVPARVPALNKSWPIKLMEGYARLRSMMTWPVRSMLC